MCLFWWASNSCCSSSSSKGGTNSSSNSSKSEGREGRGCVAVERPRSNGDVCLLAFVPSFLGVQRKGWILQCVYYFRALFPVNLHRKDIAIKSLLSSYNFRERFGWKSTNAYIVFFSFTTANLNNNNTKQIKTPAKRSTSTRKCLRHLRLACIPAAAAAVAAAAAALALPAAAAAAGPSCLRLRCPANSFVSLCFVFPCFLRALTCVSSVRQKQKKRNSDIKAILSWHIGVYVHRKNVAEMLQRSWLRFDVHLCLCTAFACMQADEASVHACMHACMQTA